MSAVLYLNAIPKNDIDQHEKLIDALAAGELLPGTKQEKLNGEPLYSIRINKKERIIYARYSYAGEQHLLILDIDKKHKYNIHAFKNFIRRNREALNAKIDRLEAEAPKSDAGSSSTAKPKKTFKRIPMQLYDGEIFQLDPVQTSVKSRTVAQGGPGTGKTCLAEHYLEIGAQHGKKVLYITQSANLVAHIKESWQESPAYDPENKNIELRTYDELAQLEGHARTKFNSWLAEYESSTKKPPQFTEEALYQEFRIRSGYSEEDYLNPEKVGQKQATFHGDDRIWINTAYKHWMQYCVENNLRFTEFHPLVIPAEEDKYDLVVVDESQDFSHHQLSEIIKLAKNKNIIFFVDPRQSLHDNNPKVIYLQTLLGKTGKYVQLETSYRSAPNIMRLAKAVSELKKAATPGTQKAESAIKIPENDLGEVNWQEINESSIDEIVKNYAHNKDVCIITTEENKPLFTKRGFTQVFTPEEIKGLQYKRAILYGVLEQAGYAKVNGIFNNDGIILANKQDTAFAGPLNTLFTSITRAKESLAIYYKKSHSTRNLVKLMKGACRIQEQARLAPAQETSKEDWLLQAEKLFKNGARDQAEATLRTHCKMEEDAIAMQFSAWKPAEVNANIPIANNVAEPSNKNKKNKKKKPGANDGKAENTDNKNSQEEVLKYLLAAGGATQDEQNRILGELSLKPSAEKPSSPLAEAIKDSNLSKIDELLQSENADNLDWNLVVDGKTALSLACKPQRQQTAEQYAIIDKLLKRTDVDLDPLDNAQVFPFKDLIISGNHTLAALFFKAKRFKFESCFAAMKEEHDQHKRSQIANTLLAVYKDISDESTHKEIIDVFMKHSREDVPLLIGYYQKRKKYAAAIDLYQQLALASPLPLLVLDNCIELLRNLNRPALPKDYARQFHEFFVYFSSEAGYQQKDRKMLANQLARLEQYFERNQSAFSGYLFSRLAMECGSFNLHAGRTQIMAEKAANMGQPHAQLHFATHIFVGVQHQNNTTEGPDFEKQIFRRIQCASDAGLLDAHVKLGHCYELGIGVTKNPKKAYTLYSKAAEHHYLAGLENQGRCLRAGVGVAKNPEEAYALYNKYARQGSIAGHYLKAQCLDDGIGVKQDHEHAYELYCALTRFKDDASAITLARRMRYGQAQPPDSNISLVKMLENADLTKSYYDKDATTQAYCDAIEDGIFYHEDRDASIFRNYLRLAATLEINNKISQLNLGRCYAYGIGVEQNLAEAFRWYKKSASAGCVDAMYAVEQCYELGVGINKSEVNHKEANNKMIARAFSDTEKLPTLMKDGMNFLDYLKQIILAKTVSQKHLNILMFLLDITDDARLNKAWSQGFESNGTLLIKMCASKELNTAPIIRRLIQNKSVDINVIVANTIAPGITIKSCAFSKAVVQQTAGNLLTILPSFLMHPTYNNDFKRTLKALDKQMYEILHKKLGEFILCAPKRQGSIFGSGEINERFMDLISFLNKLKNESKTGASTSKPIRPKS
jgi:TPR repeat protein